MRSILITGVSSGLGLASARFFAGRGWRVVGTVRVQGDADALRQDFPNNFSAVEMDIASDASVERAAEEVRKILRGDRLDVLVNNAGIAVIGPMLHVPMSELQHQLEVNVIGQIRVTRAFLPMLCSDGSRGSRPGRIVNVGSVSGLFTFPFVGPYCMSKYALEAASDALRRELFIYGIPVSVINAATVRSAIWDKLRERDLYVENTDYAGLAEAGPGLIDASEKRSMPPERFTRVLWKIAKARKPRPRYLLTRNNLLYRIVFNLPDSWVDRMVQWQMRGLKRKV